jgi:S-formylglutathione hydrolase FrmB
LALSRVSRPTSRQIRRRRRTALALFAVALIGVVYLVLAATVFAPVDKHGASLTHIEIHSKAVGRDLGVNVIVPKNAGPKGDRSLLVFLHGRGGYEGTFNDAVFRGLPSLGGRRGAVVAFPAGGVHGYWHNRADGDWEDWVVDEVIPLVVHRFGIDPHKLAIGGISMGGFGAYDIALKNPGRFCAVGGHSPALWFDGSETAPGAFDDEADFERNDVVETVQNDPGAFGDTRVWNDYGETDDFRPYGEGFVAAMEAGDADFTTHSWPGGHEGSYWDAHWPTYQRFYVNALNHCR